MDRFFSVDRPLYLYLWLFLSPIPALFSEAFLSDRRAATSEYYNPISCCCISISHRRKEGKERGKSEQNGNNISFRHSSLTPPPLFRFSARSHEMLTAVMTKESRIKMGIGRKRGEGVGEEIRSIAWRQTLQRILCW